MLNSLTQKEILLMIISAIVSGAIGLLFSLVFRYFSSIRRYLNTGIDYLLRDWFIYNISFKNDVEIINKGKWYIRKSILGGITIKISYYDDENNIIETVKYKGQVYEESGSVVVAIKGILHSESVFCRLISPNPSNMSVVYGIWLGKNLDSINTAASLLISQQEMDIETVKEKFKTKFKSSKYSIRVFN